MADSKDFGIREDAQYVDESARKPEAGDVQQGDFAPLHRKLQARHLMMIAIGGMVVASTQGQSSALI